MKTGSEDLEGSQPNAIQYGLRVVTFLVMLAVNSFLIISNPLVYFTTILSVMLFRMCNN